jgi:hypothetical protein
MRNSGGQSEDSFAPQPLPDGSGTYIPDVVAAHLKMLEGGVVPAERETQLSPGNTITNDQARNESATLQKAPKHRVHPPYVDEHDEAQRYLRALPRARAPASPI